MGRSILLDDTPQTPSSQRDPSLWQSRRSNFVAPVRLSLLRLRRSWRLLMTVGIGMLVAVTLICTVPLYSALIANVQLRQVLNVTPPTQRNIVAQAHTTRVTPQDDQQIEARMRALATQHVATFAPTSTSWLQTFQPFGFTRLNGQRIVDTRPDLQIDHVLPYAYDYAQALPHMAISSGQPPHDAGTAHTPEVLVTPGLGMQVGDTITIFDLVAPDETVTVRVVGIWSPKDTHDPFWNNISFETPEFGSDPQPPRDFPLLFTKADFLHAFSLLGASPGMIITQLFFTQTEAFTIDNLPGVASQLAAFHAVIHGDLPQHNGITTATVLTQLDTLIEQLRQQLALLGLPLAIIVALLVGLALLFVLMMAGVLIESQGGEIVTLKSRGASGSQMLVTFTLHSALLAGIIALAGPFLASLLARLLLRQFVPGASVLSDAFIFRVASPDASISLAWAGALLCVGAVASSLWQTTRLDVLAYRREQGRGGRPSLWRRYNLDLVLAGLCALGYLELGQFGGLSVRAQFGQPTTATPDPLLLATPALLLLAGALLSLRLFPQAAHLLAGIAARGKGAPGMLAFSQVARISGPFSRLALLLTLSIGLGFFALTFQASIGQNAADRAAYATGGDLRLILQDTARGTAGAAKLRPRFMQIPGIRDATPVYRSTGHTVDESSFNVAVMGIEPASFGNVAYWRDDYADRPLSALLGEMRTHPAGKNAGQRTAPIWTLVDTTFAATLHLAPGSRFALTLPDGGFGGIFFQVGIIVRQMPTLYNAGSGRVIAAESDLWTAFNSFVAGPSEYWLRTAAPTNSPTTSGASFTLPRDLQFYVESITDRRMLEAQFRADPLDSGMSGLLLVGAAMAMLLAILGSTVHSTMSTRRQATQFAILRTLGMTRRQIRALLLSEQSVVYIFGLLSGSLLGAVLATATLPFLQFSGSLLNPATLGVPPYILSFDISRTTVFYATLLFTFLAALIIGSWVALRAGIGNVLRIGED